MVAAMLQNVRKSGPCFSPDMSVVNNMWRASILDQHRYRDSASRVLARYEDLGGESMFFPCDEQLTALGVNLDTLATALDEGTITGDSVEKLIAELTAGNITSETFDDTVGLTLVPASADLPIADRLTAAAHLPSVREAARIHGDDFVDRALHAKGLCSCHVEFTAA